METGDKIAIFCGVALLSVILVMIGLDVRYAGKFDAQVQASKQVAFDTVSSAEQLGIVVHIDIHDSWFALTEHDAWGYPLRGKQEGGKVYVTCAGPDHIFGSADDIQYERYVVASPLTNLGVDQHPQDGYNLLPSN